VHARLRGAFNHQIDRADTLYVLERADVSMVKLYSARAETGKRQFTSAAL